MKAKGNWEYINYGDASDCKKYAENIFEIGNRYKKFLTGKA